MGKQSLCLVKPPYASPKVAATTVGVCVSTIFSWVDKGVIPSYFEVEPSQTSDGRRGWVRKRDLSIDPETGKCKDKIPGKPIFVNVNEIRDFLAARERTRRGLP